MLSPLDQGDRGAAKGMVHFVLEAVEGMQQLMVAFAFGQGSILGVPNPAWVLIICVIATHIILKHTLWGRYTYAIGSNMQAAVVSGISVNQYLIMVFAFAGFLAAVAGIVLTARIGSGQPGLGLSYEFDAIVASVIGGTSLAGGIGSAGGALIGALIMGVMKNGLDLLNVSAGFQQVMRAIIIVGGWSLTCGRIGRRHSPVSLGNLARVVPAS